MPHVVPSPVASCLPRLAAPAATVLALSAAPTALAVPDIMNNFGTSYTAGGTELSFSTTNPSDCDRKAYLFTTPGSGAASLFTVESARVMLNSANASYPSASISARAAIWSVSAGAPSAELVGETFTGSIPAANTWQSFNLSIVLSPNTQYAFMLSIVGGSTASFKWANVRPIEITPTAYNGYSFDGNLLYSNSLSQWSAGPSTSSGNAFALVPSPGALAVGAVAALLAPSRRRRGTPACRLTPRSRPAARTAPR
ncbi:MAG: hypothetical protein FGM39_06620 [Phycisphaerales bacterium]|nr:hypothetical protein [Phycisphaerales bacterium]